MPKLIAAMVSRGETLVLDRYVYSGIAFTVAKGLDYDYCRSPDVGLPRPDCVIFLDVPVDTAGAREGFGAERYEQPELQDKVRTVFARLRESEGRTLDWSVVDASQDIDVVADRVWEIAEKSVRWASENDLRTIE
jgi:dTMP kinase